MPKGLLASLDDLQPDVRRAVMNRIPDRIVEATRSGLALGWVDGEDFHAVVNPAFEILGANRFRSLHTDTYLSVAETPIIRSALRAALRLGNSTPRGLAKYAGASWGHLSSGMGDVRVLEQDGSMRLRCRGYPTHLGPPELFAYAFAGTYDGFYRACGRTGRTEIVDIDAHAGDATFLLPD